MGEHGEQAEKWEVPVIGATDHLETLDPGRMGSSTTLLFLRALIATVQAIILTPLN